MKNADIKAGNLPYTHVLLVKKMSKNQLPVYIVDGINVEDMVTGKTKALCHAKILDGIEEVSLFREEVRKVDLPKEEYIHVEKDGRMVTYCTLRQMALHTIGLNSGHIGRRLYTRHGKKYYKPYRNYFCGNNSSLDNLVEAGYMEYNENIVHGKKQKTYWFNRNGLDWLGEQIGIYIYDEEF